MHKAIIFRITSTEGRDCFAALALKHGSTEFGGEALSLRVNSGTDKLFFARPDAALSEVLGARPVKIADGLQVELGEVDLSRVTPEGAGASTWRAVAGTPGLDCLPRLSPGWKQAIAAARGG